MWLVGLPELMRRLQMQQHTPLAMRVSAQAHLEAWTDREAFAGLIQHGLEAAGASSKLLSDPSLELLHKASRGLPRAASKLLRAALWLAHERDQTFVDEHVMEAAIEETLT
jgi:type II secretory pathway predicted ATPase ExeA